MRNLLHVLRHTTSLASAWPQLSRAALTSHITFDFGCTRNLVSSAKLFAVGDSTRSGSLDLFDRQASYHGTYVAPTDLGTFVLTCSQLAVVLGSSRQLTETEQRFCLMMKTPCW